MRLSGLSPALAAMLASYVAQGKGKVVQVTLRGKSHRKLRVSTYCLRDRLYIYVWYVCVRMFTDTLSTATNNETSTTSKGVT